MKFIISLLLIFCVIGCENPRHCDLEFERYAKGKAYQRGEISKKIIVYVLDDRIHFCFAPILGSNAQVRELPFRSVKPYTGPLPVEAMPVVK